MSALNMFLNFGVCFLLAATIAWCWVLNRRIRLLQDSRSELAQLLEHFDTSTQRASDSIMVLQTASRRMQDAMQPKLEHAQTLLEDLAFMLARADAVASRLEDGVRGKAPTRGPVNVKLPEKAAAPEKPAPIAAVKTVRPAVEAVLEKMALREQQLASANADAPKPAATHHHAHHRTPEGKTLPRIEQELLEVLKAGV